MSRTGVGCRVLINGLELDDGCIDWGTPPPGAMPQGVSAAAGLQVTWGRSTSVDQPEPSTCTFRVIDDEGGSGLLTTLRVGQRVNVVADAQLPGPPGTSAFDDPSFSAELRATTNNATALRSQVRADDPGGWSARVRPAVRGQADTWVRFPPGPLQAPGSNPAAWAHLPTVRPGDTWTVAVRLWVPAGRVNLRPVLYTGPYATAAEVLPTPVLTVTPAPGWQTATLSWAPGVTARWMGFQLELQDTADRGLTWDTTDPALTWDTVTPATLSWADVDAVFVDTVSILPPQPGAPQTVGVFAGRITDLEGYWDADWDGPVMDVTASDFLADLTNRRVGDEPWPVESVAVRLPKILALAAIPGEPPIAYQVAATVAGIPLTAMDVDSQPAADLLHDIAQSVDGVLWSASHPVTGPFIRLEDPTMRPALYQLQLVAGVIRIVPEDFAAGTTPPELSACDLLRDPVSFQLSVADIATRTDVTWQEAPTPPDTDPTERHVRRIDTSREADYGTRGVSLSTDLVSAAAATRIADQLLARLTASWRVEGVVFSDADLTTPDGAAGQTLLTLLDDVTRGGQPLLLTDLDAWSPVGETAPVYLEGGSYSYTGGWELSLIVARTTGTGTSADWNDLPAQATWSWDAFDPDITWDQLRGVAGPDAAVQMPEIDDEGVTPWE